MVINLTRIKEPKPTRNQLACLFRMLQKDCIDHEEFNKAIVSFDYATKLIGERWEAYRIICKVEDRRRRRQRQFEIEGQDSGMHIGILDSKYHDHRDTLMSMNLLDSDSY